MAATDFFSNVSEIRQYNPAIEAATPIDQLEYAFRDPEAKLRELLEEETYDQLKAHKASGDENTILDKGVTYIQGALANMASIIHYTMSASDRNKEGSQVYKYQEDQQRSIFQDAASAELGQLLILLDNNTEVFTDWADTTLYTTRQDQLLKTHREFGKYYAIDGSAYFFSRVVFLMKEITEDRITPLVGDISELDSETDADIIDQAKKTLAYLTMAMALRRFDFVELPKTIRNNVSDSKSRTVRTGGQEVAAVREVADEIEGKGRIYLDTLALLVEKKNTGTLAAPEEINDEENSFYLQT